MSVSWKLSKHAECSLLLSRLLYFSIILQDTTNWRRGLRFFYFFPLFLVAKMAVANVPFPSFFLPCPGESAMPFCTWLRIFENYLRVIDATGESWPDVRRRAVLLHCLGTEGQRIFYSLPNIGTTYKDAEAALKAYFVPITNIVAERHAFHKRCQAPHETVIQYVAALRELVVTCEFGACADEMIRDQLVENVLSPRIRERLLLETDLTLDRAVTIASQIESASDQAKSISNYRPRTSSAACSKSQERKTITCTS